MTSLCAPLKEEHPLAASATLHQSLPFRAAPAVKSLHCLDFPVVVPLNEQRTALSPMAMSHPTVGHVRIFDWADKASLTASSQNGMANPSNHSPVSGWQLTRPPHSGFLIPDPLSFPVRKSTPTAMPPAEVLSTSPLSDVPHLKMAENSFGDSRSITVIMRTVLTLPGPTLHIDGCYLTAS